MKKKITLEELAVMTQRSFADVIGRMNKLATKDELQDLRELVELNEERMATKADLAQMATKADLAQMATKADLAQMATKADLAQMATKADLAQMATKAEFKELREHLEQIEERMATKADIRTFAASWAAEILRLNEVVKNIERRVTALEGKGHRR